MGKGKQALFTDVINEQMVCNLPWCYLIKC